ncbi:alpha,alpha-trehalase TreF [Persicobacter diffluens]
MLIYSADRPIYRFFQAVQLSGIFPDSKTFVDARLRTSEEEVLKDFSVIDPEDRLALESIVLRHFELPQAYQVKEDTLRVGFTEHLQRMWHRLKRPADMPVEGSTLLPLKEEYVVPGGRFREVYYWDSYFTLLGLLASDEIALAESLVKNFADLINRVGFVPNGNRSYYLSRSQPPVFSLMVKALEEKMGKAYALQYLPAMEKEYAFWMDGANEEQLNGGFRRIVKLPSGAILNRFWDDDDAPRPESYQEDRELAEGLPEEDRRKLYRNIRAAAESGWDFSSRWFGDAQRFDQIQTTDILPVDLNALMYHLEHQLADYYNQSAQFDMARTFALKASLRKQAMQQVFWSNGDGFYYDYDWVKGEHTHIPTLAGLWPLYLKLSTDAQALKVARVLEHDFLKPGGWITTLHQTGQQWDAPNGWAPLQWITYQGLMNYNQKMLAEEGAERWLLLNEKVYQRTGKMMEKYNVVDTSLIAGGGEYPNQDGFGWTNGVALRLLEEGIAVELQPMQAER